MKKSILYILLLFVFVFSSSFEFNHYETKKEKIKLVYVYDALCGWCYGFGSVAEKIEKKYSETVEIEIISGVMIIGDRIAPVGEMADYILSAMTRLVHTTGLRLENRILIY